MPESPIILDRWGRVINNTVIGPLEEGDDVILSCRVIGGSYQEDNACVFSAEKTNAHEFLIGNFRSLFYALL